MTRVGEAGWREQPVEALGMAGYRSVWPLHAAPEGCPWAGTSAPQEALHPWLPGLVLEPVAVLVLHARWHLVYRSPGALLLGGPPNPEPALSEEWETLSWSVPAALRALYAVHDGLGPADGPRAQWRRDAVVPSEALMPLLHRMRFGEENILYRPADLLLVAPDGRGGGACFHREHPADPDPPLRSWDAQTRALGERRSLQEVLAGLERRWAGG